MGAQIKQPTVATPGEALPGIENVETLAEWQELTDRSWNLPMVLSEKLGRKHQENGEIKIKR